MIAYTLIVVVGLVLGLKVVDLKRLIEDRIQATRGVSVYE